jgi:hypothetical protein
MLHVCEKRYYHTLKYTRVKYIPSFELLYILGRRGWRNKGQMSIVLRFRRFPHMQQVSSLRNAIIDPMLDSDT